MFVDARLVSPEAELSQDSVEFGFGQTLVEVMVDCRAVSGIEPFCEEGTNVAVGSSVSSLEGVGDCRGERQIVVTHWKVLSVPTATGWAVS
jgi:hypothetical protein